MHVPILTVVLLFIVWRLWENSPAPHSEARDLALVGGVIAGYASGAVVFGFAFGDPVVGVFWPLLIVGAAALIALAGLVFIVLVNAFLKLIGK